MHKILYPDETIPGTTDKLLALEAHEVKYCQQLLIEEFDLESRTPESRMRFFIDKAYGFDIILNWMAHLGTSGTAAIPSVIAHLTEHKWPTPNTLWTSVTALATTYLELADKYVDSSQVSDAVLLTEYYSARVELEGAKLWGLAKGSSTNDRSRLTWYSRYPMYHWVRSRYSAIANLPMSTEEEAKIAANVVASVADSAEYELQMAQSLFNAGVYEHILRWDPVQYGAIDGGVAPPYQLTAPPAGTFSKWEAFVGEPTDYSTWQQRSLKLQYGYAKDWFASRTIALPDDTTTLSNATVAAHQAATQRLFDTMRTYYDHFTSTAYENTIVYDNYPGTSNLFAPGASVLGDAVRHHMDYEIMMRTSYAPSDAVFSMRRIQETPPGTPIEDVVNSFEFFEDTDPSKPVGAKLIDAANGMAGYYGDMMKMGFDQIKDLPRFANDPILNAASTATTMEKSNRFINEYSVFTWKSDQDIYGPQGYMHPDFLNDGGVLYEFDKTLFDTFNRDPVPGVTPEIRKECVDTTCPLDLVNKAYYPKYVRQPVDGPKVFHYVYSDHFKYDEATGKVEMQIDVDSRDVGESAVRLTPREDAKPYNLLSPMKLVPDVVGLGVEYNLVRPDRAAFLAETGFTARAPATNKTYHDAFGYYYGRVFQSDNTFKYKHHFLTEQMPKFMTPEQVDFYNTAPYMVVAGQYAGYGYSYESIFTNGTNTEISVVINRMQTSLIQYIEGGLVSIGVFHEWLGGHAMVRPYQTYLKAQQIANKQISTVRSRRQSFGGHAEGFTNSGEIDMIKWGLYNKIVGTVPGKPQFVVLGNEVDPVYALGAITEASRLPPRCSSAISLNHPDYQLSFDDHLEIWRQQRGAPIIEMASRDLVGWGLQNCGYFPAALFMFGSQKRESDLLGSAYDLKGYWQAAVINAVQPATIPALDASVKAWRYAVQSGDRRRLSTSAAPSFKSNAERLAFIKKWMPDFFEHEHEHDCGI